MIYDELSPAARARGIDLAQKYIEADPSAPWSELWRAEIELLRRERTAAVTRLEALRGTDDISLRIAALMALAEIARRDGEMRQAITLLREAAALTDKPDVAAERLAYFLGELQHDKEAEPLFRSVIDALDANDAGLAEVAGRDYAQFLAERWREDEAAALLDDLIARYPESFELRKVLAELKR